MTLLISLRKLKSSGENMYAFSQHLPACLHPCWPCLLCYCCGGMAMLHWSPSLPTFSGIWSQQFCALFLAPSKLPFPQNHSWPNTWFYFSHTETHTHTRTHAHTHFWAHICPFYFRTLKQISGGQGSSVFCSLSPHRCPPPLAGRRLVVICWTHPLYTQPCPVYFGICRDAI